MEPPDSAAGWLLPLIPIAVMLVLLLVLYRRTAAREADRVALVAGSDRATRAAVRRALRKGGTDCPRGRPNSRDDREDVPQDQARRRQAVSAFAPRADLTLGDVAEDDARDRKHEGEHERQNRHHVRAAHLPGGGRGITCVVAGLSHHMSSRVGRHLFEKRRPTPGMTPVPRKRYAAAR
jgi:hypothetical protein